MKPARPDLGRTQAWMQAVLLHGGALPDALAAAGWIVPPDAVGVVVRPSAALAPEGRVAIYHAMVRARFLQTLECQFPAVRRIAAAGFPDLAAAYLAAHPSRSRTLAELGVRFASFLEGRGARALADLARLEWALHEAGDLPGSAALGQADLSAVPAEAWARARLVPVPSLRLLALDHDAVAALDRGGRPRRRRTAVAVWRRGDAVLHQRLDRHAARLLERILDGLPLSEAVRRLAPADVGRALSAWAAGGMFRAVETT